MVAHAYNPSIGKVEAAGSEVRGSLGYMRILSEEQKNWTDFSVD